MYITEANQPHKSIQASIPNILSAFDPKIQAIAKKFEVLVEMFFPAQDTLGCPVTLGVSKVSPISLDIIGKGHYASPLAKKAAVLAKLD